MSGVLVFRQGRINLSHHTRAVAGWTSIFKSVFDLSVTTAKLEMLTQINPRAVDISEGPISGREFTPPGSPHRGTFDSPGLVAAAAWSGDKIELHSQTTSQSLEHISQTHGPRI